MAIAGNILGEATPPAGNSFNEATRGNIYQRPAGYKLEIRVAGVGQRWLEVERAMGIEYIARRRLTVLNHHVAIVNESCVRFSCENDAIAANASQPHPRKVHRCGREYC
jgi:hypothetical protein